MNTPRRLAAGLAALFIIAAIAIHASDRISVYAKVDRVVLAPNADAPDTIQVFGVFSVAQPNNPNDYRPAARGYLYYSLGPNRDAARREWSDLKSVAGTGQVVAFGSRWEGTPTVREAKEAPSKPDVYSVNTGVTKVRGNTEYAPIRALLDFNR
jgi:hypothetical protein